MVTSRSLATRRTSGSQVFVAGNHCPQVDECPRDEDVHLYGALVFQRRGKHHHAVFGESVR
jgi:hypothetical protein